MRGGPAFEQAKLALASTAGQVMAAALQQQFRAHAKAHARVGAIEFFLDHDETSGQPGVRHAWIAPLAGSGVKGVAFLQLGSFQVLGRRVFVQLKVVV